MFKVGDRVAYIYRGDYAVVGYLSKGVIIEATSGYCRVKWNGNKYHVNTLGPSVLQYEHVVDSPLFQALKEEDV